MRCVVRASPRPCRCVSLQRKAIFIAGLYLYDIWSGRSKWFCNGQETVEGVKSSARPGKVSRPASHIMIRILSCIGFCDSPWPPWFCAFHYRPKAYGTDTQLDAKNMEICPKLYSSYSFLPAFSFFFLHFLDPHKHVLFLVQFPLPWYGTL